MAYNPLSSMLGAEGDKIARRAWLVVKYTEKGSKESKDISEDLAKYLLSCSYTDNIGGQADDVTLSLEDRAGLWSDAWFPSTGAMLDITLHTYNWTSLIEGEKTLPIGKFQIDEIEVQGSPSVVQIKATSVLQDTPLRGMKKNRTWEKISIWKCANDICWENDIGLYWDCDENPNLDHVEQSDESDLAFLEKITKDAGFSLKIDPDKIIIFDEMKLEKGEPTLAVIRPGTLPDAGQIPVIVNQLTGWSFRAKTRDVYWKCHVRYQKAKDKKIIETTYTDPNKKSGQILEISEQVEDVAEAERLAKKKLREKNKEEVSGSFSTYGNVNLVAGVIVKLVGFGVFDDGKYLVTKATHNIGGDFSTSVELRRCLNGY